MKVGEIEMNEEKDSNIIRFLYCKFFKQYIKYYINILLLMIMLTVLSLIEPTLNIRLIDKVLPNKDFYMLVKLILVFLLVCLVNLFIGYFVQKKSIQLDNSITVNIKMNMMKSIHKETLEGDNKERSDKIITILEDVRVITDFFNSTIMGVLLSLGNIVIVTTYLLYYSKILTLLVLINGVVQIFITSKYVKPLRENQYERKENSQEEMGCLNSTFINLKLIKSFNCESWNLRRYNSILNRYKSINFHRFKIIFSQSIFLALVNVSGTIAIILIGGGMIIKDMITIGVFVAFLGLSDNIRNSLSYIVSLNSSLQGMFVSSRRLYKRIIESEEGKENEDSYKNISIKNIEANNMKLVIGEKTIFKDLSFRVEKGKKYLILGKNGIGKSSLINSILKMVQVEDNTIFINGEDINTFSGESIRNRTSVVLQKNYFIEGSIKENLMLGVSNFDSNELEEKLELLYLNEFIKNLDNGLDTKMDDLNSKFSGGELQKIAILRSILKEGDVYLFDEPFSNIENNLKIKIYNNICSVLKGKIIVFITHDSEIIKNHDGELIEIKESQNCYQECI